MSQNPKSNAAAPEGCAQSTGSDFLVTPCCKVPAIVAGSDEGTHWHSCPKCGRPCDPVEPDAVPYDDNNGDHSDGLGVPIYQLSIT
jgi:hypothetical protein